MGKLVTTAIRASPLRCRMHPFHSVDPFGRLTRLSVSFAIPGLGSNGLLLDIAQARSVS
jgi:hypothetical protein